MRLNKQEVRDKLGPAYALLNVKRLPKPSVSLLIYQRLRNLGLSIAITYGNNSLIFHIFFVNLSLLLILGIMGITRPFQT